MSRGIPVVMYHSVGRTIRGWEWSFLTVPWKIFESHLRWLARRNYATVDLYDLYAYVSGEKALPEKSVVLTFDDGYLDNWGYAAPLLEKYRMKGTVFVNPEFVDPRNILRPTLRDVWANRIDEQNIPVRGFMSWKELRALSETGPLSIQSHAMTHTWYPSGDRIIDFVQPGKQFYWLDWNTFPERKPFYLKSPGTSEVPLGTPVYQHEKALAVKRWLPDIKIAEAAVKYVRENGGKLFFDKPGWRDNLFNCIDDLRGHGRDSFRIETDEEQSERFFYELSESKRIIESRLDKSVDFLCWPGGGYNEKSQKMAFNIYSAVTLGSRDSNPAKNRPGEDPRLIKRVGVPCFEVSGGHYYPNGQYLIRFLKEYQGSKRARRQRQLLKIGYYAMLWVRQKVSGDFR